jgi:hypothetical protein
MHAYVHTYTRTHRVRNVKGVEHRNDADEAEPAVAKAIAEPGTPLARAALAGEPRGVLDALVHDVSRAWLRHLLQYTTSRR